MIRKTGSEYFMPTQGCTNVLAENYDPNAVVNNGSCEFAPAEIIAIINDGYPTHAEQMLYVFKQEYGQDATLFNEQDIFLLEYAQAIGCDVLIKSYGGMYSYIPAAEQYYPDVQMFMPLGDNRSIEIFSPPTLSVIIACGAGDIDDLQNMTAYGNGLEFWDNEGYFNPVDESSYSNPIIASKIMKIRDARDCSMWEARYCARFTADRNEPNRPPDTIWHKENGFGKINVEAAIAFSGEIPADPFVNNTNVYTPFIP